MQMMQLFYANNWEEPMCLELAKQIRFVNEHTRTTTSVIFFKTNYK